MGCGASTNGGDTKRERRPREVRILPTTTRYPFRNGDEIPNARAQDYQQKEAEARSGADTEDSQFSRQSTQLPLFQRLSVVEDAIDRKRIEERHGSSPEATASTGYQSGVFGSVYSGGGSSTVPHGNATMRFADSVVVDKDDVPEDAEETDDTKVISS